MTINPAAPPQRLRRRPRLSTAVVEDLVNAIVMGTYPIGTALPPENILCDMYDVSRTVVREATTALTEKGLVVSQQGRGTIVCDSQVGQGTRFTLSFPGLGGTRAGSAGTGVG